MSIRFFRFALSGSTFRPAASPASKCSANGWPPWPLARERCTPGCRHEICRRRDEKRVAVLQRMPGQLRLRRTILVSAGFAGAAICVLAVIVSPFLFPLLDRVEAVDWSKLSNIGQAYGGISALIATVGVFGVAASLLGQVREARRAGIRDERQLHAGLLLFSTTTRCSSVASTACKASAATLPASSRENSKGSTGPTHETAGSRAKAADAGDNPSSRRSKKNFTRPARRARLRTGCHCRPPPPSTQALSYPSLDTHRS